MTDVIPKLRAVSCCITAVRSVDLISSLYLPYLYVDIHLYYEWHAGGIGAGGGRASSDLIASLQPGRGRV